MLSLAAVIVLQPSLSRIDYRLSIAHFNRDYRGFLQIIGFQKRPWILRGHGQFSTACNESAFLPSFGFSPIGNSLVIAALVIGPSGPPALYLLRPAGVST